MPTLHIHLLGDFHVLLDDTPITSVIPPRVQSLLAYLALHSHTPQSRQRLAFLFWPDSAEDQAHNNLRQSLHQLRQILPNAERFFRSDKRTVQWLPDAPFTLDVAEFEKEAQQASSIDALRQSVNRYQGDLLSGCYDEWVLAERERIRQEFIQVLERLVVLLENERDYRSAIRFAEFLLRSDPLREETYRQLIRLHGLSGNQADAHRVFQTCVTVLKRELDVVPSSETNALYEQVRKQEAPFVPPALASPRLRTNNLPKYLTSFVGRKKELEELERLFSLQGKSSTRLLTLTGTGGCGKTRLAIHLTENLLGTLSDGAWFVDLVPLNDSALIPRAIASVLGVQEQPDRSLMETLAVCLQPKELVLILDNCEHLVDACARLVESLLRACPTLQVLATSREKLNVMGEVVWRVPALSQPDPDNLTWSTLSQSDAVQLFAERACAVLPTFTLNAVNAGPVAQICQRLGGIPLAIELAAARIAVLTPTQIATRLDNAFQLLTQGSYSPFAHHQTLRATMDWSYGLLSTKEQILFRRLAVFAGGFTLEAVETVCAEQAARDSITPLEVLDLLSKLTDKSLVHMTNWEQGEQARYRLLEPIWQYANEQLLRSGDLEQCGSRHLEFFLNLAEEAEPHFSHTEQAIWFNRLMADHDNLMAAVDWSLKSRELTAALRLTGALWYFWLARGYYAGGVSRLMQAISLTQTSVPSSPRAKALWAAGAIRLWSESDWSRARPLLEEAVAVSRTVEDRKILAGALGTLGATALSQGDYTTARAVLTESLALLRELDDQHTAGWSLTYLGDVCLAQHDEGEAQKLYAAGIEHFKTLGDINSAAYTIRRLGIAVLHRGDYQNASKLIAESLGLNKQVGYAQGIAACLGALAELAVRRGQLVRAARLLGAAEAQLDAVGGKLFPTDRANCDLTLTRLRAQLEKAPLDAAWAEGRALRTEEAIAYAMKVEKH